MLTFRYLLLILMTVSVGTQFIALDFPREVVFDEVHFGKFITAYCCTGERFFDIHPPHGKLLIAASAKLGGYNGNFSFETIGQQYGNIPVTALRFAPALAGAALPLVLFALLRQLGVSELGAFAGGLAIALDNAFTVQSRIIALDGLLLLATFGALSLFLLAQRLYGKKQLLIFAAAGAAAGFAAGVKFTGLAALILIVIISFRGINRRTLITSYGLQITTIIASAMIVYLAGWYLHFSLLDTPGSGDAWGVPTGHFLEDTITLHKKMLSANYGLTADHPYSSPSWTWPLMKRAIFYWQNGGYIYFIGNPVVWWGAGLLFFLGLADTIRKIIEKRKKKIDNTLHFSIFHFPFSPLLFTLSGFIISFAPFLRIPRALFLYHYMTPLVFSLLFGLIWLDRIGKKNRISMYTCIAVAIVIGFVAFAPLTYGLAIAQWRNSLFLFSSWR